MEKIKNLTPIQNTTRDFKKYKKHFKKDFKLLNETKMLHLQKNHLSREQLKEYSILFIMLNYKLTAESKIEELSEINFSSLELNKLKNFILKLFTEDLDEKEFKNKVRENFINLTIEIEKNSSLKDIMIKKNMSERQELLDELLNELKEMNHLKRIEFLEGEVAKNLDETSYSELIKLKSQLNGD